MNAINRHARPSSCIRRARPPCADRTIAGMKQALACALVLAGSLTLVAAGPRTFTVEPARSRATINVGKAGAFSFAGHTHEIDAPLTSGVIRLDPDAPSKSDVRLEFNAAAMRVVGKDEPPDDVPKVTQAMLGEMVLDVKKFPSITFESTNVTSMPGRGAAPSLDLTVAGKLTIRGTTK